MTERCDGAEGTAPSTGQPARTETLAACRQLRPPKIYSSMELAISCPCSRARGEPVGHQFELGACGRDVALAGLLPTEARVRVQEMRQRSTPDRYAAETAVQRAASIMAANCDAVAELPERVPTRPQDARGNGFEMLEKHDALCKGNKNIAP